MKRRFIKQSLAVAQTFLFLLVFCGSALAVTVQNPSVQNPSVQNPSKNRCNPGYAMTSYQGKQMCVK